MSIAGNLSRLLIYLDDLIILKGFENGDCTDAKPNIGAMPGTSTKSDNQCEHHPGFKKHCFLPCKGGLDF